MEVRPEELRSDRGSAGQDGEGGDARQHPPAHVLHEERRGRRAYEHDERGCRSADPSSVDVDCHSTCAIPIARLR